MSEQANHHPPTRHRRRTRHSLSILVYALAGVAFSFLCAFVLWGLARGAEPQTGGEPSPPPVAGITPAPTPTEPTSVEAIAPTSVAPPTPTPASGYDFTQCVPETAAVESDYFVDAVFVGDSRTDGLKLYGGVEGADFIEHTGITVFEVGTKQVIRMDGKKYTVLDALGLKQYKKVYLMLGVNELGYFDNEAYRTEYANFVDKVRALQPEAVLYLQNLVSVNPEKAAENSQPYYVTNEQISIYNQIIADIAAEKHTALVDINAALVNEEGILPREGTTDGVHFTKDYYKKWYEYLKTHTVDADLYWAE